MLTKIIKWRVGLYRRIVQNTTLCGMENILLYAFPLAARMEAPRLSSPVSDKIYELRSYEGPTEKLYRNKVTMFNAGDEVGLFKRLGFNAVFMPK